MTKQDFMERLRLALNGKVSSRQLTENLDYYDNYINTEIRKGRSEEEVMAQLGDPRLIARTIVETGGGSGSMERGHSMERERATERGYYRESDDSVGGWQTMEGEPEGDPFMDYSGNEWYGPQGEGDRPQGPMGRGRFSLVTRVPWWVWLIVALLVVVLILSAIFSVIAALLPILLPILLVLFLVKVFRDWIN